MSAVSAIVKKSDIGAEYGTLTPIKSTVKLTLDERKVVELGYRAMKVIIFDGNDAEKLEARIKRMVC